MKLQNVVSEIVRWRLNTSLYDTWYAACFAQVLIAQSVRVHRLTVRSCICWMNELTKIDKRLTVYFSAVALLHVACRMSRTGFNDELMDILRTILGHNVSTCKCCSLLSQVNELNTPEVVELLQIYCRNLQLNI